MPTAEFDCPYCHQHFTIKKSLIARKKGYVRCAHCKHHFLPNQTTKETLIFDDNIGLDDDTTASASPDTPATTSNTTNDFEILDNLAVSVHDTSPVFAKEIYQAQQLQDESWLDDLLADDQPNSTTPTTPSAVAKTPLVSPTPPLSTLASSDLPTYMQKVEQRLGTSSARSSTGAMTLAWVLGSVVLALLLLGQYAVFNVNTLMQTPSTATLLTQVCNTVPINCNLAYANTTWADAQVLDITGNAKHTDVIFRLTNTGNAPLLYPNLVITLRQGNTVKAQAAVPASLYTEPNSQYLLPNQIQPIKLRLDFAKSQVRQANIEPFY